MAKKSASSPAKKDVDRMRQALRAGEARGATEPSADLTWARRLLAGEQLPAPGDALRPEVAQALVDELVAGGDGTVLAYLSQQSPRQLAKAARTGLHRLRSAKKVNVALPVQRQPSSSAGSGRNPQLDLPSLVTVYDGLWERVVIVAEEAPRGVLLYQARLSALFGLLDLGMGEVRRREYRAKMREILGSVGGAKVREQDARWLVHEAARRCEAVGRSLPQGFVQASQALGRRPQGDHPATRIAPDTDADLMELYQLPELSAWIPDRELVQSLSLRIDEAATSRLVLNPAQQQQRIADIVDRAIGDYYTPRRLQACHALLLDTAHLVQQRGQHEVAVALRTAADVFNAPTDSVVHHPFARAHIERLVLGPAGATDQEPDADDTGPAPGQGGLILP